MPPRHDRSLNAALAEIAARLAGADDGQVDLDLGAFGGLDFDCISLLADTGLIVPAEPSRSIFCDGCERNCVMPVEVIVGSGSASPRLFVVCDKRDDIGRVPVDPERLRRWRATFGRTAEILSALLRTDRQPVPSPSNETWGLGGIRVAKHQLQVVFDPGGRAPVAGSGLTVTLCPSANSRGPTITLPRLLAFDGHVLKVDRRALQEALKDRFGDPRVACEIRHERGDIVLVNHVTGAARTLASPQFNSSNDNAFQVLFDNPGREYSLEDLREATGDRTIADLHKMVENLRFENDLKKLFFRVSKNAIRFDRTATLGQLATLRIDPKSIS